MKRPTLQDMDRLFPGRAVLSVATGVMAAHDRALEHLDVTTRQVAVLVYCDVQREVRLADVAHWSFTDISSASRMLSRLEAKGLIARTHGTRDRRTIGIEVTEAGRRCIAAAIPPAAAVAEKAWAGVTESERAAIRSMVRKMEANLKRLPGPNIGKNSGK